MIFTLSQQFKTSLGTLTIVPAGHGAVCFRLGDLIMYIDPYSETTDYSKFPKADIVFFTHDHFDHYDKKALEHLVVKKTIFVGPRCMEEHLELEKTLNNGEVFHWKGIEITAVPAYNIINKKDDGQPFHPKGYGNGYVFTFGDFRVYSAGDTELIPEMDQLGHIDVALLPKNLPYTMSDEQFLEAARRIGAPVVYPIHYFELDKEKLERELGNRIKLIYE
ncbi:MAG: MBL fold metallo-hydrolase [Bacteroidales bacterium]|nr:MBL fold metallo-hydrolase [Bacteroidales bacterium]